MLGKHKPSNFLFCWYFKIIVRHSKELIVASSAVSMCLGGQAVGNKQFPSVSIYPLPT